MTFRVWLSVCVLALASHFWPVLDRLATPTATAQQAADPPPVPAPNADSTPVEPPAPEPPAPAEQTAPSLSDAQVKSPLRGEQQANEEYELLKLFADTLDQIERNYVQKVSRRELMEAAIEGMLSRLDPYSNYIAPDEIDRFRRAVESEFGGIGIQIAVQNGELIITNPLHGAPAFRAGLLAGDRITQIEGQDTKNLSIDDAVRRLKGDEGTQVSLTVMRRGDPMAKTVVLTRERVRVQTVLGEVRQSDGAWRYFLDNERRIAYVRITAFARHTASELKQTLQELRAAGMEGLVLDLRFNPGGLLSAAIEISDLFLPQGVIVSTEGRNAPRQSWSAKAQGDFERLPMTVLINHYSASASEIVSACLQDHRRAVIVGERSWGKGSVQNVIELEDGKSALKLTTAGYLRPSGRNIHRFEGASEEGEWGVAPNEGFAVKFNDDQTRRFLEWRRLRDLPAQPGEPPPPDFTDTQLARAVEQVRADLNRLALSAGDVLPIQPPGPE